MTVERDIKARLTRMGRMRGAGPEALAQMRLFDGQQNDWYGKCRHCGASRRGSLDEMKAPCLNCGNGKGEPHA